MGEAFRCEWGEPASGEDDMRIGGMQPAASAPVDRYVPQVESSGNLIAAELARSVEVNILEGL